MCRKIVCIHWPFLLFFFTACAQNGLALWRAGIEHWPFMQNDRLHLATNGHCPHDTTHMESTPYLCKAKIWHWWSSISHVNAGVSNFGPPDCTDETFKKMKVLYSKQNCSRGREDTSCSKPKDPHNASQSTWGNVFRSRWWSKNSCYLPIFGSITTFDLHSVNVPQSVLHLWNHVSAVILFFFSSVPASMVSGTAPGTDSVDWILFLAFDSRSRFSVELLLWCWTFHHCHEVRNTFQTTLVEISGYLFIKSACLEMASLSIFILVTYW